MFGAPGAPGMDSPPSIFGNHVTTSLLAHLQAVIVPLPGVLRDMIEQAGVESLFTPDEQAPMYGLDGVSLLGVCTDSMLQRRY